MQQNIQTKGFYKSVMALVVPMALQNLINVGVQSADVVMLGWVGEISLSAASLAGQIQFLMTLIFFGIASGASVLTAQYWGKNDVRTIEKVIGIALRLSMSVAILFFIGATFFPDNIMRVFSPDPRIISEGTGYLRIAGVSYLFMGFTNLYLIIIRSVENVIISTVVYGVSLVTNVTLNAVFIFGLLGAPAMGVRGAALATTIARGVECLIVLIYALRNPVIKIKFKDIFASNPQLFKDFSRYSMPTTVNEILWGGAITANAVIVGHLGASAVAANSVSQVMRQLATVVCFGIGNASAVMLGKTIGAGKKELALDYSHKFMKLTGIAGCLGGMVILALRPFIITGLKLSDEASGYLSLILLIQAFQVIIGAFNTTLIVGVFRSGGDTRVGLLIDVMVMWFITIPLGAVGAFVFKWPVEVIFMILLADEILKLPLALLRYKSRRWLRDVTRPELSAKAES